MDNSVDLSSFSELSITGMSRTPVLEHTRES